jgi:predicted Rossmann-fold nucleotide-binding protein
MAAMNQGAHDYHGHIVGVIHEKFVVDGSDWFEGAHSVFAKKESKCGGGSTEILIARGNDLQERKRLLVEGADALVVLPGGPGTWDEVRHAFLDMSGNLPLFRFCSHNLSMHLK